MIVRIALGGEHSLSGKTAVNMTLDQHELEVLKSIALRLATAARKDFTEDLPMIQILEIER